MNDVGDNNGLVQLEVENQVAISYDKMIFRKIKDLHPNAFTLSSWYGGSDETWSPDTTVEAYFKNFKMYSLS